MRSASRVQLPSAVASTNAAVTAFWRVVLGINLLYELAMVFLLFQDLDSARSMLQYLDPSLGRPLPEKSYAENCEFTPRNVWVGCTLPVGGSMVDAGRWPGRHRHFLPRPCVGLVREGANLAGLLVLLGEQLIFPVLRGPD